MRPLFKTLRGALLWAYRAHADTTEVSKLVGMMRSGDEGRRHARDRLLEPLPTRWDAVAQAGLIKSFVNRMPIQYRRHLVAKYAVGGERATAQAELIVYLGPALRSQVVNRRLLGLLVAKFYGKRGVFFKRLVEQFKLDKRDLGRLYRQVLITLDALGYRAESMAYDGLREKEIIE